MGLLRHCLTISLEMLPPAKAPGLDDGRAHSPGGSVTQLMGLAHPGRSPGPCCKVGPDSTSSETALGSMARRWTLVWVVEPSWRQ